jgi:hypothetical protein
VAKPKRGAAAKADEEEEDEDDGDDDEAAAKRKAAAAAAAKAKAAAPAPNYDAMNEAVLRALCLKRGIQTDAKPTELRQRLRDDDVAKGRVPKKIAPIGECGACESKRAP